MQFSELFSYDETGAIRWKVKRPGRGCVVGKEAGTAAHHGYRAVMVDGKKHYVHRVIWEMHRGSIPNDRCIDHIDGNRSNNKLENLRLVTLSENQRNTIKSRNNSLGIMGVYLFKSGYLVQCASKYIGFYGDFFEACCARKSVERKMDFHPNHGRRSL